MRTITVISTRGHALWAAMLIPVFLLFFGCGEALVRGTPTRSHPNPPPGVPADLASVSTTQFPSPLADVPTAEVGSMAGGFSVTPQGVAVYSIPIEVPPGRNGIEPHVSFTYESNAANGVMGVGFSLGGLSSITRCPPTLALNGFRGPLRFDERDRYCMDGQPLVMAQGGSEEAYSDVGQEFRTEPDSFSRIRSKGGSSLDGPDVFVVETKDGRILEYGACSEMGAGCSWHVVPKPVSGFRRATKAWLLRRISDRSGNYAEYSYRTHTVQGEGGDHSAAIYLDKIEYSPFRKGKAARRIEFGYLRRPDVIRGYSLGNIFEIAERLSEVRTYAHDAMDRRYSVYYESPTIEAPRSRVHKIQECTAEGRCKPATFFTWTLPQSSLGHSSLNALPASVAINSHPVAVLDADGDGFDDLLQGQALPGESGWRISMPKRSLYDFLPDGLLPEVKHHLVSDRNLDGSADLLTPSNFFVDEAPWDEVRFRRASDGFHAEVVRTPGVETLNNGTIVPPEFLQDEDPTVGKYVLDLNGDGSRDLITCTTQKHGGVWGGDWEVRFGDPKHDGKLGTINSILAEMHGYLCWSPAVVLDSDQDGGQELYVEGIGSGPNGQPFKKIWADSDSTWLRVANAGGLYSSCPVFVVDETGEVLDVEASKSHSYRVIDVNGDGVKDIVRGPCRNVGQAGTGYGTERQAFGYTKTFINTGAGFIDDDFSTEIEHPASSHIGELEVGFEEFGVSRVIHLRGDGRDSLLIPEWNEDEPTAPDVVVEQLPDGWISRHWMRVELGWQDEPASSVHPPEILNTGRIGLYKVPGRSRIPRVVSAARVGDFDGDGLQDLANPNWSGINTDPSIQEVDLEILVRKGSVERIVEIRDGLHGHSAQSPALQSLPPTISVDYETLARLQDAAPGEPSYKKGTECQYPTFCVVGPRTVVAKYSVETGVSDTFDGSELPGSAPTRLMHVLHYEDGRSDFHGRGWIGFAKRREEVFPTHLSGIARDRATVRTETEYDLSRVFGSNGVTETYPTARLPKVSRTLWHDLQNRSHLVVNRNAFATIDTNIAGSTYFVYPQVSYSKTYEVDGWFDLDSIPSNLPNALASSEDTIELIDLFGNVVRRSRTTNDGHVTRWDTLYQNNDDVWSIGLPLMVQVQDLVTGDVEDSSLSRERFTWNVPKRRLREHVVNDHDADHRVTARYEYNPFGTLKATRVSGSGVETRKTETLFDDEELYPIATEDSLGYVHLEQHRDKDGQLLVTKDPNGQTMRFAYDGFGRLGIEERPDLSWTLSVLSQEIPADAQISRQVVNLLTVTPGMGAIRTEFDRMGRARRTFWTAPSGDIARHTTVYDPLGTGQVVRELLPVDSNGPTQVQRTRNWVYDRAGRLSQFRDTADRITLVEHHGLSSKITNPRGAVTEHIRDAAGRIVQTVDALGHSSRKLYGAFGRLRRMQDTEGHERELSYDEVGNLSLFSDPNSGLHLYGYDAFGQLRWQKDNDTDIVTLDYDNAGRLLGRHDADGDYEYEWDTAPNGIGRPAREVSPDGIEERYQYDQVGRLSRVEQRVDGTSYFSFTTYDALSRVRDVTYPNISEGSLQPSVSIRHSYDGQSRLTEVTRMQQGANLGALWTREETNIDEEIVQELQGNGVQTRREFDPVTNELRSIKSGKAQGGEVVQLLSYQQDSNGNLVSRFDGLQNLHERFSYDALDRLCEESIGEGKAPAATNRFAQCEKTRNSMPNASYAYDSLGNLLKRPGTGVLQYDTAHPNRVNHSALGSYEYDGRGNQIKRPGMKIEYTAFDLPKTIVKGHDTTEFRYGARHQRVFKENTRAQTTYAMGGLFERVVDKQATPRKVTHRFLVPAAGRMVAVIERPLFGPKGTPGEERTRYIHDDHIGNADVITDEGGNVIERNSYDAFGKRRNPLWNNTNPPGPSILSTLGYTGHEDDDDLGLINMKGRLYDPTTGRMMQADPIVANIHNAQNLNRYSYVRNNPLTLIDPSGWQAVVKKEANGDTTMDFADDPLVHSLPKQGEEAGPPSPADPSEQSDPAPAGGYEGDQSSSGDSVVSPNDTFVTGATTIPMPLLLPEIVPVVLLSPVYVVGTMALLPPLLLVPNARPDTRGTGAAPASPPGPRLLPPPSPTPFGDPLPPFADVPPRDEPPDWIFRWHRPNPLEGSDTNPYAAQTVGEHVWGREHLPGSPFRSWTSDPAVLSRVEKSGGGGVLLRIDLRKVPTTLIAADLRTQAGRESAAVAERATSVNRTSPDYRALVGGGIYSHQEFVEKFYVNVLIHNLDSEVILRGIPQ